MPASVEPLGGNRWRVRVYAGIDPVTGRQLQVQRSFRADGVRAAERAAVKIRAQLLDELNTRRARTGTVAELVDRYLTWKKPRWSPTTATRNTAILTTISADLGRLRLDVMSARHVDDWYVTLAGRGLAPSTVRHYGRVLNAALRQGQRWDMVQVRATENATPPPVPRHAIQPPTNQVVRLLLEEASGPLRAALTVAAYAGLRRGEVIGLRWSDLVPLADGGAILHVRRSVADVAGLYVKSTKTGRERAFVVPGTVVAELAALRDRQTDQYAQLGVQVPVDGYLFADLRADPSGQTPMRPGWLSLSWDRHRKRLGATGVRLHDLRHWNATTMMAAGVDPATIAERLGHADITTTLDIYSHAVPAVDGAAAATLAAALAPPVAT